MKVKVKKEEIIKRVNSHAYKTDGTEVVGFCVEQCSRCPDELVLEAHPEDKQLAEIISKYCEGCGDSPCEEAKPVEEVKKTIILVKDPHIIEILQKELGDGYVVLFSNELKQTLEIYYPSPFGE